MRVTMGEGGSPHCLQGCRGGSKEDKICSYLLEALHTEESILSVWKAERGEAAGGSQEVRP